jgi:hypothetical protein
MYVGWKEPRLQFRKLERTFYGKYVMASTLNKRKKRLNAAEMITQHNPAACWQW